MNSEQVEKNFSCLICYEFADRAVEGECCGVLLCEKCYQNHRIKSSTCPICAKQNYKTHESYKLRIIINNLLVQCRQGCGVKIQNKSRFSHESACKALKQLFKSGANVSQFLITLFQIWKFCKFESPNSTSVQIKGQKCMVEKIIINFLTNLIQLNAADKTFILSLTQKCKDLFFCLSLIYYEQMKYFQAVQWYMKAFQMSISPKLVFLANQVFTMSIYSIIEKKDRLGQMQKIVFEFSRRLNPQKQLDFILNSICWKLLVKIANVLNADSRQVEYIIMLSNMEDQVQKICLNIYQRVCWFACLHHQLVSLKDENLKDQIQQVSFEVAFSVKLMKTVLRQFGKNSLFLHILLQKSEQILSKQLFQSFDKKINPILAENSLIQIIQTALLHECKASQQNKLAHIDSVFYHSLIALQLFLYSVFHFKFRKIQKSSETINDKVQQMFNKFKVLAKNQVNLVQNIVSIQLSLPSEQVDASKVLKQRNFQFKLICLIKKYIEKTLTIIGRENINLQNELVAKLKITQLQLSLYPKNCQDYTVLKFCSHFYMDCLCSELKIEQKQVNRIDESSLEHLNSIKQYFLKGIEGEQIINKIIEKTISYITNQRLEFSNSVDLNKNPFVVTISDKLFSIERIRQVLRNYVAKLKSYNTLPKTERKIFIIKRKSPQKIEIQKKTEQKKTKKSLPKEKKVEVTLKGETKQQKRLNVGKQTKK